MYQTKQKRDSVVKTKRIVVKIGSSLLANLSLGIEKNRIADFCKQLANIYQQGIKPIVVTSGAVAVGATYLKLPKRPTAMRELQAAAAIGQGQLMRLYSSALSRYNLLVGQVLLTRDVLENRVRYLNARNTLEALLELGSIPIVNENDSVVIEEIQFGDNDLLSSMVASMSEADTLIILSDVDGLYQKPPALGTSDVISYIPAITREIIEIAGKGQSELGRGGMQSKLKATEKAVANGINVVIASGLQENILTRIMAGEEVGSFFQAQSKNRSGRKRWLSGTRSCGSIIVDNGAKKALLEAGKSLLAIGMLGCNGVIAVGDTVSIRDEKKLEIALGICNFSSADLAKIKGVKSCNIAGLLGRVCADTVVHRDNLVIVI